MNLVKIFNEIKSYVRNMKNLSNKQVTLTVNNGLINIESTSVHTAELISMLVNAIGITILNVSDGIITLLKGEVDRLN